LLTCSNVVIFTTVIVDKSKTDQTTIMIFLFLCGPQPATNTEMINRKQLSQYELKYKTLSITQACNIHISSAKRTFFPETSQQVD